MKYPVERQSFFRTCLSSEGANAKNPRSERRVNLFRVDLSAATAEKAHWYGASRLFIIREQEDFENPIKVALCPY